MGSMWRRGVSAIGGLGQSLPYVSWGTVPKFPMECPPYVYIAWERRFNIFISNQGLGHTISPGAPRIDVISCADDTYLLGHFGEALVTEHRRTWGYICDTTAGAPFENRLHECHSVSDALRTMKEWALPLQPAERHLLAADLEGVQFMGDEDPKFFFERISRLETTFRAVGIGKNESEIVQIILRQLPERYDIVKTMTLAEPQLTRQRLENTIRSAYSQRKTHEIAKLGPAAGTPAEPPNPHVLVVGRDHGDREAGGGGGHQVDGGMIFRGGDMPRQQQQQQRRSRGGGMPWRQQQQQHWSRGGGMPCQPQQQQQCSRGGGIPHQHQRSSHTVPPARQARQQPSRGIPPIGVGGIYDCGSNAVYDQEDSPPPPGAPMCAVYRCGRCGKHGHKPEHCAAPRRFEGTCGACDQYGHMCRNCALSSRQPHLNVFTSSGECYVTDAHGADTIVIPKQQHHQPAVDLGGEDIPFQQPSDTMHYSIGMSGGGRGEGDALDTGVPSDTGGVVETCGAPERGSGGDGEDGGGPLSGTFSGGDDVVVYGGFFALQLVCFFTPNPSSQMLSAISSLFANRRPGSTTFLGDTGAVIHGVSSADCVYNRRQPRPWERYLMLGDGKCMMVGFYGDLDLDLHCEQDVRVTLTNVAVVPGLAFDIMSFNRMQEKHEIILNGAGASMLGGRVRFKKFRAGNFIQATRVPHDDASPHPPAMVAAMMRPGAPSSMDVNDCHNFLGHANIKTLYEAAKQMGNKLTGIPFGYHRQAFQGEVPTWGGVLLLLRGRGRLRRLHRERHRIRWQRRHLYAAGVFRRGTGGVSSSAWGGHSSHVFVWSGAYSVGSGDIFTRRGFSRRDTGGVSSSAWGGIPPMFSSGAAPTPLAAATSSRGGGFPTAAPAASAAPRGGGIPPMFSSGAVPTPLAAATSSRGGGFPAATPAASAAPRGGGIPPMFSSGAAPTPLAAATSSRGGGFPPRHRRRQQLRVGEVFLPCFRLERRLLRWQRRHLHAAGVFPPRHRRRQQLRVGGAFLPCFHLERRLLRWQRRHLHAAEVFPPRHRRRQQLRVGGAFLPCFRLERRLLRWQRRHLHAAEAAASAAPRGGAFRPCFRLEWRLLRRHLPAAGALPPRFQRRLLRRLR